VIIFSKQEAIEHITQLLQGARDETIAMTLELLDDYVSQVHIHNGTFLCKDFNNANFNPEPLS